MKKNKLFCLLLLLAIFILMPISVYADTAAPMITKYEVRVINPDGVELINWKKEFVRIIEYDEVFIVSYETIIDGELYGGNDGEFIKLSETQALVDKIDLSKLKHETKIKLYAFEDTCYLYKGPSKAYGKLDSGIKLKEGTIVESEYYDDMWVYVTYNGESGWVYMYNIDGKSGSPYKEKSGLAKFVPGKLITLDDLKLLKSPKTEESIDYVIPNQTELTYDYVYTSKPSYYYVTFNGISGWIRYEYDAKGLPIKIAIKDSKKKMYVINKSGINLYERFNLFDNGIDSIPYKTELDILYSAETLNKGELRGVNGYYVEYNGKKGWVNVNFDNGRDLLIDIDNGYTPYYEVLGEIQLYDGPYDDSNIISLNIPVGSIVEVVYSYTDNNDIKWNYITYNGEFGWVNEFSNLKYLNHKPTDNDKVPVAPNEDNSQEVVEPDEEEKINPVNIVYICVISAIIIGLVTLVTILLINKKKEEKGFK